MNRILVAAQVVAVACVVGLVAWHFLHTARQAGDFIAFYCGGHTVAVHRDPYLIEPIRSCEHALSQGFASKATLPAPIPGYVLSVFALLSFAPYPVAALLYICIALTALGIEVFAISALTRASPLLVLAIISPIAYVCINLGQLVPIIASAAIAVSALLVARKHFTAAAIVCCVSMIEPHIGLTAVLAMLLWMPKARLPIVACAVVLLAESLVVTGWRENWEYLTAVLPGMERAETGYAMQYSTAWLAHTAGASYQLAAEIGTFAYIIMLIITLPLLRQFAAVTNARESMILLAPLAAILGAAFLHVTQLIFVLPAALFLLYRGGSGTRLCGAALLLVMVPWLIFAFERPSAFLAFTAAAVAFTAYSVAKLIGATGSRRWLYAASAVFVMFVMIAAIRQVPTHSVHPNAAAQSRINALSPHAFSTQAWQLAIDAGGADLTRRSLAAKIPSWLGVVLLFGIVVMRSRIFESQPALHAYG